MPLASGRPRERSEHTGMREVFDRLMQMVVAVALPLFYPALVGSALNASNFLAILKLGAVSLWKPYNNL
jgi:hypothetical protein